MSVELSRQTMGPVDILLEGGSDGEFAFNCVTDIKVGMAVIGQMANRCSMSASVLSTAVSA